MKRGIVGVFALWVCLGGGVSLADSGAVARIGGSGDSVELSYQVDGRTVVDTLPLNRAGSIRYFSAGVGLEEREAEYPPFSLKVVFTAGRKPYLTGVSVEVQPEKGGMVLTFPRIRLRARGSLSILLQACTTSRPLMVVVHKG